MSDSEAVSAMTFIIIIVSAITVGLTRNAVLKEVEHECEIYGKSELKSAVYKCEKAND